MWTATADAADTVVALLAGAVAGERTVVDALRHACEVTADAVAAEGVVIALADGDGTRTVAASSRVAHVARAGPPWPAAGPEPVVSVADLARAGLPDGDAATLAAAGVRAAHDVRLRVDDTMVGVLRLLVAEPGPPGEDVVARARLLASAMTLSVVAIGHLEQSRTLASQLDHALGSRVVIEQAKGIVHAVSPDGDGRVDTAFELLRRYARSRQRRVREVAEDIVAGRLDPAAMVPTDGDGHG